MLIIICVWGCGSEDRYQVADLTILHPCAIDLGFVVENIVHYHFASDELHTHFCWEFLISLLQNLYSQYLCWRSQILQLKQLLLNISYTLMSSETCRKTGDASFIDNAIAHWHNSHRLTQSQKVRPYSTSVCSVGHLYNLLTSPELRNNC